MDKRIKDKMSELNVLAEEVYGEEVSTVIALTYMGESEGMEGMLLELGGNSSQLKNLVIQAITNDLGSDFGEPVELSTEDE